MSEKTIRTKIQTRVCTLPITPHAIRFNHGEVVGVYFGRPADGGGPALPADDSGFVNDGYAMTHYMGWIEERTVYEIDPDPWGVV